MQTEINSPLTEDEATAVRLWRQGDYTLDFRHFPTVVDHDSDGPIGDTDAVEGFVVISQTCDIVNQVADRNFVVVAPLIASENEKFLEEVAAAATPAAAPLEHPPSEKHIVDLTRTTTISKAVLAKMVRAEGFSTEVGRNEFARQLERRYGRFAFPDELNPPLSALRAQSRSRHNKDSDVGRVYRSIRSFHVAASPDFDTKGARIRISVLLEDPEQMQTTRDEILKELESLAAASKFKWPAEFEMAKPFFVLLNRDEMTVRQYEASQRVDLDFISRST